MTNMEAAMQFYTVYNDKRVDLVSQIFAPEYVGHVNAHDIVGAEAAAGFISGFLQGIPDAFYDVHDGDWRPRYLSLDVHRHSDWQFLWNASHGQESRLQGHHDFPDFKR